LSSANARVVSARLPTCARGFDVSGLESPPGSAWSRDIHRLPMLQPDLEMVIAYQKFTHSLYDFRP
jgi:hypothetical protein